MGPASPLLIRALDHHQNTLARREFVVSLSRQAGGLNRYANGKLPGVGTLPDVTARLGHDPVTPDKVWNIPVTVP
jgi:hypothetical protein